MNKIILQIGALAFCVSVVAFSTQKYPMLDTVARAFIVFIIVTVALSVLLALSVAIVRRERQPREEQPRPANKPSQTVA
jgi:SNF family Na+-dependent transporter